MFRNFVLIGCVLCAAILIGCSKTETTTNTATDNSNKATAPAATPASGTTAASGDKIGVPECDDFIAKYEACVTSSKVPELARAPLEAGLKTWRSDWKKLAENPQTRATLVGVCKQAKAQQETALKAYGCSL